jgi:hypothetical protein
MRTLSLTVTLRLVLDLVVLNLVAIARQWVNFSQTIGNIVTGQAHRFWIRRSISTSAKSSLRSILWNDLVRLTRDSDGKSISC